MNQQLPNITSEVVRAYQEDISNSLSRSSAKRKASSINKFLEWAGQEGYINTNLLAQPPVANHKLPVTKLLAWASFVAGAAIFVFAFTQAKQPAPTNKESDFVLVPDNYIPAQPDLPIPTPLIADAESNSDILSDTDTAVNTTPVLDALASLSVATFAVENDLNLDGNLKIGGVTRFNSLGRLASITGYYQDSGLFEIDQGAADWAKLEKVMTGATGAASTDVLTLTLDESALTTGSEYDALVISRKNAGGNGYALFVDDGDVHFDGNVEYVGALTDVSDARLKENFQAIQNPLSILESINGTYFNMIGSDRREVGVIAQEVQLVLPEAVSVVDYQKGYLGVSYTSIIPVMVEGIKELAHITNEVANRNKIISPVIETEFLSPVPEKDLTVKLTDSSRFTIQNPQDKEVASIDSEGNATFGGEVRAEKLYSTNLNEIETTLREAEEDISFLVNQDITIGDQVELVNVIVDKLNILLANTLRVETNGDVVISGNLYVAGSITTNKLVIANPTPGESVPNTPGVSGAIESNASAGSAKIASGSAEITIKNPNVSQTSLVYVTPTTATKNQVLYVKDKQPGSLVVGFEEPTDSDIAFNWWIVDLTTKP
ncbi:hypothetical protein A3F62_03060 [Candidatus Woesebacteria bacterium RIFCSPHIGHO2_12_FULL_44_11]|uniref:Peptidase S74 domain-containing protein n=1 Tax=Candidatus Woesebacteria bacterium RIFCSPLOWO2_01_FULL_44_14 TaxID=1802525 RepID=A0A1F8C4D7_9BACT|nr:MAG: hypothetical protein A3F62_03060 [Candidatus Woesebacteria bacterium RIFCSPHIGHO2_12_FULL_44_11]OGM70598.1 MAG: hypothetical protein A2975_00085 [Candidatus Woesebacteria bacterium RIFCSPLOWO2_01_FULL_44_14]